MGRVMSPGSAWLNARPTLHIYEEWSGLWDDAGTPQSVHEDNLYYLKGRQDSEGTAMQESAVMGVCYTFSSVCGLYAALRVTASYTLFANLHLPPYDRFEHRDLRLYGLRA
jgi:hypothetical protein